MAADLWALRYPDTHHLWVLDRPAGGVHGGRPLDHASTPGTVRVRSPDLTERPATVVASERMDGNPLWRALAPGELVHVGATAPLDARVVSDRDPAGRLTLADLHPTAAASQA